MSIKKGISNFFKFDQLIDHFSGFVEKKIDLLKIELKEEAAAVASKIIVLVFLLLLGFLVLLFCSILLGAYLNEIMDSNYLGFAAVSMAYFMLMIFLMIFKDSLRLEDRIEQYILRIIGK